MMKRILLGTFLIITFIFVTFYDVTTASISPAPTSTPDGEGNKNFIEQKFGLNMPILRQVLKITPVKEETIAGLINQVDSERFTAYVESLVNDFSPRYHNSFQIFAEQNDCSYAPDVFLKSNLQRALDEVEELFAEFGYEIIHEPVPDSNGSYNLIAYKPAIQEVRYPGVLEVGAHIDTNSETPGAGDNATGVAGVMEMARLLKDYPNKHPWRFIIFISEELGLAGSSVHVQNIVGEPFKAALVMDGIGWSELTPEYMNCIYASDVIPYSIEIANLFDWVRKEYNINIAWRRCSWTSGFSDQSSYWNFNLPSVLSVGGLPWKDPDKHKCSDNMANVDLMNAFLTVQENLGVFLTLDQEP
jgi:hypothetical protein